MKRYLSQNKSILSNSFYNIKSDLSQLPKPPLHPGTKQAINADDMKPLFTDGFIEHETSLERNIEIPEKVKEKYSLFRPTPLIYAKGLKDYLDTPAEIFFKYEGTCPMGSHKSNTAIMQAYFAANEGIKSLVTETGAGQWGSALSHAGQMFGVDVEVFMVRTSYKSKPGRKVMMEMFDANVYASPSINTTSGMSFLKNDSNHPGSLGIAISEAVETTVNSKNKKYALGSVLDSVLLHQTIIGQEAILQLEDVGIYPDIVVGCVGGGSNFGGIAFPFLKNVLNGNKNTRFIAVEPEACPSLTKGELRYDFGDSTGYTPLLHMHTLGMDFIPPAIHSGGLRYHGMAPLVSHLYEMKLIEAVAYSQNRILNAAKTFLLTEGILPAPESSHAIAAAIDEALKAKAENRKTKILFNLSGHGFFDFNAFAEISKN